MRMPPFHVCALNPRRGASPLVVCGVAPPLSLKKKMSVFSACPFARICASTLPMVKACVRASLDLQPPPITGAESLHVLKTVFACYRAAETGRTEKVG